MKTNKAFSKRIKVTKNGKLVSRNPGGNHYNAKESRSKQLNRNRAAKFPIPFNAKLRNRFLPN